MRTIGVLDGGNAYHARTFQTPKYAAYIAQRIPLRTLQSLEQLEKLDVLIVPSQLHLGEIERCAPLVHAFSERGKIVVVLGPQPLEWIPNQRWEYRPTNFWGWLEEGADSGLRFPSEQTHSFYDYFDLAMCTWHQHGVYHPVEGTKTLVETDDGAAVLYIDQVSTKGTWVVTTLDPDYHFGSYFMPATERFLDQLFPWLALAPME